MKFKTIFWDNDGTLVNTEVPFFLATQKVLASVGIELTEEWNANECLKKGRSSFELAEAAGIDEETIQKLRERRDELYFKELKKNVEVMEGVIPTLEELYGRVPMGIVTTSPRMHFNQIMKATGLGKYFDFTICGDEVEQIKPHPEPYLKAWRISGFKKSECLVIEDTGRGLTAAKRAGLPCFICPTAYSKGTDFSQADKVIDNVSEILEFFN
ncbi:MAG: HAD family phosphatase [Candidatus Gracilibacteria bacterium]|jgi:HAD superfamily hydrolase (TIGR01509 family)